MNTTVEKLYNCVTETSSVEEAVDMFFIPRRGRPRSEDVVFSELAEFAESNKGKKEWQDSVIVAIGVMKRINENKKQKQGQKQKQNSSLVPPQFGQNQISQTKREPKQSSSEAVCKKNDDGSIIVTKNGKSFGFSKKQLDFFKMITELCENI